MEEEIKKENSKNDDMEACQKKADEYLNNWKRSAADFINYKKEEMERIGFLANYAKEDIIHKILPIFDSFYLAESHANIRENVSMEEWYKGFEQIKKQIEEFLKKEGIEEIETVGHPSSPEASDRQRKFDPNLMEVIEEVEIEGMEPDIVVEELQRGYKIQDKVLRPAKVKISK